MNEQYINILERIHASYYQLSAAERKVADYVLSQHTQVQFMSITQLADECSVAEATVSRFCRSLGLKGFNAFKLEMARHVATANAGMIPPRRIDAGSREGRCMEAARLAQEAIQQTIELVQPHNIEQAVELIDVEDVDEVWELTLEKLVRGMQLAVEQNYWDGDIDSLDGEAGDIIFQMALFDEIVFG